MKTKSFLQLYSNIIPVNGHNRSLLCDFQFNKIYYIPNIMYDFLKNGFIDVELYKTNNNLISDGIEKWVNYLIEKDLAFYTQNPEFFPKMSLDFELASDISNMIIEVSQSNHDFIFTKDFINSLNVYGCKGIVLNYIDIGENTITTDVLSFSKSVIDYIEIYVDYNCITNYNKLLEKLVNELRIKKISFYNCTKKLESFIYKNRIVVDFIKIKDINIYCGVTMILEKFVNIKLFTESQHHNSCLNRKLSIDKEGNIKNCPSMSESFGNIKETTIKEALQHPNFNKYWNITKDQIEVCKDCEFRHICTDCRAYTERSHFDKDIDLSKPLKCGYNPYTNEWEEWSINPLKQKAIEFYGMEDLAKNMS